MIVTMDVFTDMVLLSGRSIQNRKQSGAQTGLYLVYLRLVRVVERNVMG